MSASHTPDIVVASLRAVAQVAIEEVHDSTKANMEDATVKITINDFYHIGPEKAILLGILAFDFD